MPKISADLIRLGELAGIESGYLDGQGVWHTPSLEAYLAILPSLGVPIQSVGQAGEFRTQLAFKRMHQPADVVQTVWSEGPVRSQCPLVVQMPEGLRGQTGVRLLLEAGEERFHAFKPEDAPPLDGCHLDGKSFVRRVVQIPQVPWGVHEIRFDFVHDFRCWLIVAPRLAHRNSLAGKAGKWGMFLPVHAMRSAKNHGCGTYTDLGDLLEWTAGQGGGLVGTLPLLAGLTENPCEPSPYSPASRLFWNELYLDVDAIPELSQSALAKKLMDSHDWRAESERLRQTALVEHEGVMKHLRPVLEHLVDVFPEQGPRARALAGFLEKRSRVREYASFRAKHDLTGQSWHVWLDGGRALEGTAEFTLQQKRRLIWQFWAEEQIEQVAHRASGTGGPGLYLDLPIGVHGDGFDVYRFSDSFAPKVSAGAPPDSFFTRGQDWGFPPPHPWCQRLDGYRYLREVLDQHMRLAGLLRIDHVMGLHRLYWVPWGLGAKEGAYVRYPYEELYALYCLNSVRHGCCLAGEDLGTVPPAVRPEMESHHIHRLYVGQFSFQDGDPAMASPPPGAIASLNTHDLPTFCGFWTGGDIADRVDLGLIDEKEAEVEHALRKKLREQVLGWLKLEPNRTASSQVAGTGEPTQGGVVDWTLEADASEVFLQLTISLEKSDAAAVLVNAEDLWKALEPQNVPGTWKERPNWRRKAPFPLEHWQELPGVSKLVKALNDGFQKSISN
jgi:4-alpha-glucanotransferase